MVCSLLSACPCNGAMGSSRPTGGHAGRVTLPWRRPKGRPPYRRGGEKVRGRTLRLVSYSTEGALEETQTRIQDGKRMRPRIGAHPANSSLLFRKTFQGFSVERRVCSYAKSVLTGRRPPISSLRRQDLLVLLLTIEAHKVTFPLARQVTIGTNCQILAVRAKHMRCAIKRLFSPLIRFLSQRARAAASCALPRSTAQAPRRKGIPASRSPFRAGLRPSADSRSFHLRCRRGPSS